eukprot:PhF_6_TR43584/c0_g1_i1/m.66941/K03321/TC.SULP; sulfate permease, SulP family
MPIPRSSSMILLRSTWDDNTTRKFVRLLFRINDGRYEDSNYLQDIVIGFTVALVSIPLSIGFAVASGFSPANGIASAAVGSILGGLFGGSKYQVVAPTAVFVPLLHSFGPEDQTSMLLCSVAAGVLLCCVALLRYANLLLYLPQCVVVGMTIGVSLMIICSSIPDVFGMQSLRTSSHPVTKFISVVMKFSEVNYYCIGLSVIALVIWLVCKTWLPRTVPGPFVGIVVATVLSETVPWLSAVPRLQDRYGPMPQFTLIQFTPPTFSIDALPTFTFFVYNVCAIASIASIETLLFAKLCDRFAKNEGLPFHPSKEVFGLGIAQIVTAFLNGIPVAGTFSRSAYSIQLGASSPIAAISHGVFCYALCCAAAPIVDRIPLCCVGMILCITGGRMVSMDEVRTTLHSERVRRGAVMIVTAVVVFLLSFFQGVVLGTLVYYAWGGISPQDDVYDDDEYDDDTFVSRFGMSESELDLNSPQRYRFALPKSNFDTPTSTP